MSAQHSANTAQLAAREAQTFAHRDPRMSRLPGVTLLIECLEMRRSRAKSASKVGSWSKIDQKSDEFSKTGEFQKIKN